MACRGRASFFITLLISIDFYKIARAVRSYEAEDMSEADSILVAVDQQGMVKRSTVRQTSMLQVPNGSTAATEVTIKGHLCEWVARFRSIIKEEIFKECANRVKDSIGDPTLVDKVTKYEFGQDVLLGDIAQRLHPAAVVKTCWSVFTNAIHLIYLLICQNELSFCQRVKSSYKVLVGLISIICLFVHLAWWAGFPILLALISWVLSHGVVQLCDIISQKAGGWKEFWKNTVKFVEETYKTFVNNMYSIAREAAITLIQGAEISNPFKGFDTLVEKALQEVDTTLNKMKEEAAETWRRIVDPTAGEIVAAVDAVKDWIKGVFFCLQSIALGLFHAIPVDWEAWKQSLDGIVLGLRERAMDGFTYLQQSSDSWLEGVDTVARNLGIKIDQIKKGILQEVQKITNPGALRGGEAEAAAEAFIYMYSFGDCRLLIWWWICHKEYLRRGGLRKNVCICKVTGMMGLQATNAYEDLRSIGMQAEWDDSRVGMGFDPFLSMMGDHAFRQRTTSITNSDKAQHGFLVDKLKRVFDALPKSTDVAGSFPPIIHLTAMIAVPLRDRRVSKLFIWFDFAPPLGMEDDPDWNPVQVFLPSGYEHTSQFLLIKELDEVSYVTSHILPADALSQVTFGKPGDLQIPGGDAGLM